MRLGKGPDSRLNFAADALECGGLLSLSLTELARFSPAGYYAPGYGQRVGPRKAAASCRTPKRTRSARKKGALNV